MAARGKHFKVGLFVILGLLTGVLIAVVLGAAKLRPDTVEFHTFFDESVQGLETGAPVKFRGVKIGNVSRIEIAPDHRHVAVVHEIESEAIRRMGLTESDGDGERFRLPPDLRAQLGTQGITGVKYINVDFFDPATNPPPPLPFPQPDNTIPAAVSLMKNLEDSIAQGMEKIPELVDATVAIMERVDRMAAALEDGDVVGKVVAVMMHADQVLTELHAAVKGLDKQRLPQRAAATLDRLQVAVDKVNKVLDRVDGDAGLVATAQRSFSDVGRSATGTSREIDVALRDIREAADAIRRLAESLERDPDMLLKGREKKEDSK